MAMQEALRREQPIRGDDRLAMRIVIGLGDVGELDGDFIGEVLALIVRIETITPADEIYLTPTARFALVPAEVQTSRVDAFALRRRSGMPPVALNLLDVTAYHLSVAGVGYSAASRSAPRSLIDTRQWMRSSCGG